MGNEWGEAYRVLNEQKKVDQTPAERWEEARHAHWKLMREAWLRYNELVAAHEARGFNGRNPWEKNT